MKKAPKRPAAKGKVSSIRTANEKDSKLDKKPRLPLTVVGIGASAGGLEAFIEFFKATPANTGMAFVAIQHLAPDRVSMLAEILGPSTTMPVLQVKDGMKVEPDHVYIIRPGRTLTIRRGILKLGKPVSIFARRHPVDDFFRSLAEEQRERAICIIMSGMGSNGTAGAQMIKAAGGLCIAQDPASAQYSSMPQTLIDAGLADFVLPPSEIPAVIGRYSVHPYTKGGVFTHTDAGRERQAYDEILQLIRNRLKHDFTFYRKPTIVRRIERRMGLNQLATMSDYLQFLRQSPPEVSLLTDDLLIHVTGFFRDPLVWQVFRSNVIEPLVAKRPNGATIRAWVTACSSGEEAYSLAILLVEAAEAAKKRFDIKIFATDASEASVTHARNGQYPGGIESEVSPERLKRFFEPKGVSYRVRKELRDLVVFAPQNLLHDPPFARLDICTCRNFLIYLEPAMQHRVLNLLHFSLQEGGFLLLGNSETLTSTDGLFAEVDRKNRIFRRIGPTRHGAISFTTVPSAPAKSLGEEKPEEAMSGTSIAQLARKTLLNELSPAAVVVDERQHIVYFHGNTDRYLAQPEGHATREVMKFLRKPLRAIVRDMLSRVVAQRNSCTVRLHSPSSIRDDRHVEVSVVPLLRTDQAPLYLIAFSEHAIATVFVADGKHGTVSRQRLVRDLQQARDELQSTVDELQASNEEMKAAHEETMSVNEELQSTNEELETSKEELQALNDELATVNSQLQGKMEELENSANDINSLLSSTDIAVVFLDAEMHIRKYTPAVKDLFQLIDYDVGRPLADLALKFVDPTLTRDIKSVLNNNPVPATEVLSNTGRTYMRRVLPHPKDESAIKGVVVTFVDISERKAAEMEMRRSEKRHTLILRGIKEYGIFMLSLEGRFAAWTAGAEQVFGYKESEAIGQDLSLLHTEEDREARIAESDLNYAAAGNDVFIERWHVRKDGSRFWGTGMLSILNDENNRPYGFVKVVRDNTDRKLAQDALEHAMRNAEAANASKDHFLANVSHELRTPLSATLLWAKLLLEHDELEPKILREGLTAIARSAKEQQALIEDLMDTSKIVAGKMSLEMRIFDLNLLLQTFLPPLRSIAAEKNLVIDETLGMQVGVVEADPRRIQQVVSNLLNNAIKFTPSGGRICVQTERKGEIVEIRVADNGKGIKKEFLSRIFDRFVQVEHNSTPTASGMGLGLAIVKQLVEMHGGTVRAESAGREQGALFTVTLPLPRHEELLEEPWTPVPPAISLKGKRILLVEDTAETRHALERVLVEAEAEVVPAETAAEALAEYDRSSPDLILSDIGLNDSTGHQLMVEIRKRERAGNLPTIPAVALTAYADEKNLAKAFESGFQDCATKPIDPSTLLAKLANLDSNR